MRPLLKLTLVEMKLYLREPMAAFFTLAYAPMILFIFGFIYGNEPTSFFGGSGYIDIAIPSFIALIIASVGLMTLPIDTGLAREKGVLRRFHSTPLSPAAYIFSKVLVYYLMTFFGLVILFLIGKFIYGSNFEGNYFSVFAGFTLSTLSFFAFGFLIASLAPTARTAQIIGMVITFPMMFLSGAAIPIEVLSEKVVNISKFLPLYHIVTFMRGLWIGDSWSGHLIEIFVLTGILILGTALSARFFKWE